MRIAVVLAVAFSGAWWAQAQVDLELIDLPDVSSHGAVGGIAAYSLGFTVCNTGDAIASWQSSTNQHPTEAWGMYRIRAGRIEQIGLSWVKHGNFAASTPGCGACNTTINGARLGPGCRDTYDALFNSSQFGLGPRSDINAATGAFPYPPTIGWMQTGNAIFKRCQAATSDLPSSALYVFEGLLAHPQDAAAENDLDNASYRLASVNGTFAASFVGATVQNQSAIQAWRDHGLGVNMPDASVMLTAVDVVADGRLWVGSRATDLGGGMWEYEYAVQNLNSHRSVGGFAVPLGGGLAPATLGFHDVSYHSGDLTDGTDWSGAAVGGEVRWTTTDFAVNPNANAVRWGTLYNFRFQASSPPMDGEVRLEMFRPGLPASLTAAARVPRPLCRADFNGVGGLTVQDLFDFLDAYFSMDPRADWNQSGSASVQDLFDYLAAYFAGCP